MDTYQIDVWFIDRHPGEPDPQTDWRRYTIFASDPVEAELIATQMCYAVHFYPVRSSVLI